MDFRSDIYGYQTRFDSPNITRCLTCHAKLRGTPHELALGHCTCRPLHQDDVVPGVTTCDECGKVLAAPHKKTARSGYKEE